MWSTTLARLSSTTSWSKCTQRKPQLSLNLYFSVQHLFTGFIYSSRILLQIFIKNTTTTQFNSCAFRKVSKLPILSIILTLSLQVRTFFYFTQYSVFRLLSYLLSHSFQSQSAQYIPNHAERMLHISYLTFAAFPAASWSLI